MQDQERLCDTRDLRLHHTTFLWFFSRVLMIENACCTFLVVSTHSTWWYRTTAGALVRKMTESRPHFSAEPNHFTKTLLLLA